MTHSASVKYGQKVFVDRGKESESRGIIVGTATVPNRDGVLRTLYCVLLDENDQGRLVTDYGKRTSWISTVLVDPGSVTPRR